MLMQSRYDPSAVGEADKHSYGKRFDHTEIYPSLAGPLPSHMT